MVMESMKDWEKQVTEDSMDAVPAVQVMAGGEEQDPLILVDGRINPVEGGGVVAAKMNLGLKNWRLPYWLIAGSVIVMTNHIHVAPKLIPPKLAMFAFLCGTVLVFRAMKKRMM